MRYCLFLLGLGMCAMTADDALGQATYRKPPQQVSDILNAAPPPGLSISPNRETIALLESARYPAIAEVAEPQARLAGLRLNPKTFGPARQPRITGIKLMPIGGGDAKPMALPAEARITSLTWALDGQHFAVTGIVGERIALWIGDLRGTLTRIDGVQLNAVLGEDVQWLGNDKLLLTTVPKGTGAAPTAPLAPSGPVVQQSTGTAAPVRTYQDMLANSHDEALFDHLGTAQAVVCTLDGKVTMFGKPGMIAGIDPSPNGMYFLVTRIERPYSYLYPVSSFPKVTEVWDAAGKLVHVVHKAPLQDKVPIEGVPVGPRGIRWIPTDPATLLWAEALDEGNPKKTVPFRDVLVTHAAPFNVAKAEVFKIQHRFRGASFLETGEAMIADYDRERRWGRTVQVNLATPDSTPTVVFDRSVQDRYGDPGAPQTKQLANGERVLRTLGGKLVLASEGATAKGDFPYLSLYDPATKSNEKVFACREGYYETVAAVVTDDLKTLVIRRESPTEPANYFLKVGDKETQLTKNVDPFPELRQVKKQIVTTKRADGVPINFTLYTPANAKPGEKLPTIFWAYPREFNDASTAGQVSGSPNRFTTIAGYSHLFFLTQGYAIMDEVSIPIVGPPETANDTFVEQLVGSAKAAIDYACDNGPVDRNRIGVGGHSYGAFMTANLLAHSNLFRAGIARSGAYNRTLTPFGFQNERRTYWEAPEIYAKMSPFQNANKIDEPILLIHGQADSNPGTFPVQSERLYQAIRGNGGTVRLVLLPHEDHGYSAKESIEHVLAEQLDWFDEHVKNAKLRDDK